MNGSHFLDGVWFATGLNVVRVQGEIDTHVAPVETEDIAAATLRFDNGAVGALLAGAHLAGSVGDERFTLFGTEGTLRVGTPYHNETYQLFLRRQWRNNTHTSQIPTACMLFMVCGAPLIGCLQLEPTWSISTVFNQVK